MSVFTKATTLKGEQNDECNGPRIRGSNFVNESEAEFERVWYAMGAANQEIANKPGLSFETGKTILIPFSANWKYPVAAD